MDYGKIKAVNWSALKYLAASPKMYRYRLDNPEPPKAAYTLGSAVHTMVLEPEKFASRFGVYDGRRTGKDWVAWQAANPRVESLRPDDMQTARTMADAIASHPVAARVLSGGRREEITEWADEPSGLRCKGRLDYTRPDRIADLKTTRTIDPRGFAQACAKYLYHGQVAFYHDGAIAAGKIPPDAPPPWIVAAQNVEPYDVAVYALSTTALWAGRRLYRQLIGKLEACTAASIWPGVAPDEMTLEIPNWAPGLDDAGDEF